MSKFLLLMLSFFLLSTGCVERTLEIKSVPEGASVYLDNELVGLTPLIVPFTYYGNRSIRIEKDGYVTLVGTVKLSAPWHSITGIDFISENLIPATVYDRHNATFTLTQAERVDPDEAIRRAREYSSEYEQFKKDAAREKQDN